MNHRSTLRLAVVGAMSALFGSLMIVLGLRQRRVGPAVMLNNADKANARLTKLAESPGAPCPNFRETTRSKPRKPSSSPTHWRRVTLPVCAVKLNSESQIAVSIGCNPTIKAASPDPIPALTAAQTPPR